LKTDVNYVSMIIQGHHALSPVSYSQHIVIMTMKDTSHFTYPKGISYCGFKIKRDCQCFEKQQSFVYEKGLLSFLWSN